MNCARQDLSVKSCPLKLAYMVSFNDGHLHHGRLIIIVMIFNHDYDVARVIVQGQLTAGKPSDFL